MASAQTELDRLSTGKYLALTTFRKDGRAVTTPVWVTRDGAALYVITGSQTGKAKRLRNSSEVRLAPCDMRGRVLGAEVPGTAVLLDKAGTEKVQSLVRKRFGVLAWVLALKSKISRTPDEVGIEITL